MIKWKVARKKPVVVSFREVAKGGEYLKNEVDGRDYFVNPLSHFIIKGIKGELYSIRKDIFYETYEVLEPDLEGCFSCGR